MIRFGDLELARECARRAVAIDRATGEADIEVPGLRGLDLTLLPKDVFTGGGDASLKLCADLKAPLAE